MFKFEIAMTLAIRNLNNNQTSKIKCTWNIEHWGTYTVEIYRNSKTQSLKELYNSKTSRTFTIRSLNEIQNSKLKGT